MLATIILNVLATLRLVNPATVVISDKTKSSMGPKFNPDPTICYNPPHIENSDQSKMSSCIERSVGKHCKIECVDGYQPTKVMVKCISMDGAKRAEWDTTHAECKLANSREIVCRDNHNHAVDWFILYKQSGHEDRDRADYFIITEKIMKHYSGGFTSRDSAPCMNFTLLQTNNDKVTFAMYSDQPPINMQISAKYGHAKGIVAKSGPKGFVLFHSLPHYPKLRSLGISSDWSQKNAQMFMCISFNAESHWHSVVDYVKSLNPFVYDRSADWDKKSEGPTSLTRYLKFDIKSLNGEHFRMLSKSEWGVQMEKDIYKDIISKEFHVRLLVCSWQNESGDKIKSECSRDGIVDDVKSVAYKNDGVVNSWPSTKDHSKWAVSRREGSGNLFCVSDLNRVNSQRKRYGGAVCMDGEKRVVGWFQSIIGETECHDKA